MDSSSSALSANNLFDDIDSISSSLMLHVSGKDLIRGSNNVKKESMRATGNSSPVSSKPTLFLLDECFSSINQARELAAKISKQSKTVNQAHGLHDSSTNQYLRSANFRPPAAWGRHDSGRADSGVGPEKDTDRNPANRRSSSAIVLERGFGQDPSERAKLAMEEFHNDVDSWEDSRRVRGDDVATLPGAFATYLSQKYLENLLDTLQPTPAVRSCRKEINRQIESIARRPAASKAAGGGGASSSFLVLETIQEKKSSIGSKASSEVLACEKFWLCGVCTKRNDDSCEKCTTCKRSRPEKKIVGNISEVLYDRSQVGMMASAQEERRVAVERLQKEEEEMLKVANNHAKGTAAQAEVESYGDEIRNLLKSLRASDDTNAHHSAANPGVSSQQFDEPHREGSLVTVNDNSDEFTSDNVDAVRSERLLSRAKINTDEKSNRGKSAVQFKIEQDEIDEEGGEVDSTIPISGEITNSLIDVGTDSSRLLHLMMNLTPNELDRLPPSKRKEVLQHAQGLKQILELPVDALNLLPPAQRELALQLKRNL